MEKRAAIYRPSDHERVIFGHLSGTGAYRPSCQFNGPSPLGRVLNAEVMVRERPPRDRGRESVEVAAIDEYDWGGRTERRHRDTILESFGVRPFDDAAEEAFRAWLMSDALPKEPNVDTLDEWITAWLQQSKVDRPGDYRFDRAMRSAKHAHDGCAFADVLARLDAGMRERLDAFLAGEDFERVRADPGQVHTVLRGSYGSHYRRMLPKLLAVLDFRSNNTIHRPLLDAIDTIKSRRDEQKKHYKLSEIAVEGVIRPKWRDVVIEDAPDGERRVNRMNYELCVLQSLRDQVRCKEVWIAGAERFRNPDDDLPSDFAERRSTCYERLGIPLAADVFVDKVREEMTKAQERLNERLPRNAHVRLDARRKKKPIIVSKLAAQPDPVNLAALKTELGRRWPMTSLLDVLKESDLRIGFTDAFATAAARETVDRDEAQRRLLLCLYGLGTNAGLKRLGIGNGVSYKELLHTRRRYLHKESFRDATRRIV